MRFHVYGESRPHRRVIRDRLPAGARVTAAEVEVQPELEQDLEQATGKYRAAEKLIASVYLEQLAAEFPRLRWRYGGRP